MTTYIGHMWFDNDPHANIEQKIRKALAHYATAGMIFNVCKVSPLNTNGMILVDGVRIFPDEEVLPHHFWFSRTFGGEVWSWCPNCGDRQYHNAIESGDLLCLQCGMLHGQPLPQDCAVNRDSHSNPREPGGVGG